MKTKKHISELVSSEKLSCTVAYFNMLLSGKKHASYRLAKVLAKILDTPIDIWCDELHVDKRRVAYRLYDAIQKTEGI